jgi:hypothetical protein
MTEKNLRGQQNEGARVVEEDITNKCHLDPDKRQGGTKTRKDEQMRRH